MARAAIRKLLMEDSVLIGLGFGPSNIFGSNATDSPPDDRFIVISVGDTLKSFGNVGVRNYVIWVHKSFREGIDYSEVDDALSRIRDILTEAVQIPGDDDWTLTAASWNSDSSDLKDDGYGTITKNSSYRVSSRRTYVG